MLKQNMRVGDCLVNEAFFVVALIFVHSEKL